MPILFLPGLRAPGWAQALWASLSLEDMIAAVARGDLKPLKLGVGTAGNQVFFEQACCGLLPHLSELREALGEADTFSEGWRVLARATQLSHFLLRPNVRFGPEGSDLRRASAFILKAIEPDAQIDSWREARHPVLKCSAMQYGALGLVGALMRSGLGGDWRGRRTEHFECPRLLVEAGRPTWILLDGDPVRFEGPVEFRFVPSAIQTFIFNPANRYANDNPKDRGRRFRGFSAAEPEWNFPPSSHVAMHESRRSGDRRHNKQV